VDALDLLQVGDGVGDVVDRGAERRVVDRLRGALEQDGVADGLPELVGEHRVDVARLARAGLVRVELLGADRVADHERGGDERDPAEDRRLLVARAPAAHAGRDVVRLAEG
jgi:hypothetical protein